jgi:S-adenosylmethionine decarboxylase proenzyme
MTEAGERGTSIVLLQTCARHWLVELTGCDAGALNDLEALRGLLWRAVEAAGATPVAEVFHPFSPHGVTGVVVIEESHLSIHTWPETGYAAVDFYTCGEAELDRAVALLADGLGAARSEVLEVQRGLAAQDFALRVTRSERLDFRR